MRNFNEILRQAQELQKKLEQINAELEQMEIEATAQNMVKAKVNGKLEVISIEILQENFTDLDKEMLEDLIVVVIKDAQNKAKLIAQEKFASLGALGGVVT
ncbi:YbaB/EbfC family nucleoid-associated protein [Caldisericum sp. AR60]|uniref:YbaB/EbfC family nucleoid-associated protein n=1 Tax=Caldisericum sp. AR60 TaxID=3397852 RepID=UPI0039FD1879